MKPSGKKRIFLLFEAALLGLLVLLVLLTGAMIRNVQRQMEQNAAETVKGIFQKSENLINSDLLSDLNNAKRFASYIPWDDKEKATAIMQAFLQEYDYAFAIYLGADGAGYDSLGRSRSAADLPFAEEALAGEDAVFSPVYLDDEGVCQTVIEVPVTRGGTRAGAFYVGVPVEQYSSNTIAKSFRSDGYFYLVDRRSGLAASAAFATGETRVSVLPFEELLASAGYTAEERAQTLRRMEDREEFSQRGTQEGEEYYFYLLPVAENDQWYLCGMIPSRALRAESDNTLSLIAGIIEMLVAISGLGVAAVLYFLLRRHKAERAQAVELETRNATYEALSEKSDVVVCLFDRGQHKLEQVFRNSKRILGRESGEYLQSDAPLREICELASPGLYQRLMDGEVETDENYQLQIPHAVSGQLLEIRFTIKPGVVIAGRKKYMFYWEDVTQSVRIQDSLRTAAQAAQQASRAKSDFLSNMSHEIRTPMNAIIGMVEIMERHADDPERIRDSLRKTKLSAMHLLNIINDILDLSRIESGKVSIQEETFCLSDLIESVADITRPQTENRRHTFDIHIHDLWHDRLCGDWMRLNQVLINILNNAVKYTRPGGQINFEIMESPSQREGYVSLCFQVHDNGIGMSPEFVKRLGAPFEQEQSELHIQEGGTGLGLSIVFNIVSMMGGVVSVESEKGVGTAIAVRLDLKKGDAPESTPGEIAGMRVIVADDDPLVCEDVTAVLSAARVQADSAFDGRSALEKIREAHQRGADYDVAIVDWVLPGMDGLTLTKAIHEQVSQELPVIFVSAYDWSEIKDEAQWAGIEHFIEKPLFCKRLYSALASIRSDGLAAQGKPELPVQFSGLPGLRVLLAEDNDLNREIAVEFLKVGSIEADTACNGREALEKFLAAPAGTYGAVLMDLQMPEMDGLTACRRIRQSAHPEAATIPIIAMTANAFEEDVRRCLRAGMNVHLAKPLDLGKLLQAIERCTRADE